jgi:hypothetical protein
VNHFAGSTTSAPTYVRGLDLSAKVILIALLAVILVNPDFGNLEGKAPTARAITYSLLAFTVPAIWLATSRPRRPFPWLADLLVTFAAFSDILGNRMDLYDTVVWFDDWMHFMNSGFISAAIVLLTLDHRASLAQAFERSLAYGLTFGLGWELFEYASFVSKSTERSWAYTDTLGDLGLGWLGSAFAAYVIHALWRRQHLSSAVPILASATARDRASADHLHDGLHDV